MSKKALIVGLAMLAASAVSANEPAAERVLCSGAEIKNLERNQQFGAPVIVGTEYIVSDYHYEQYRWNRVSFVLGLIEYAGYERSNTNIVILTAKLFPLRGDSIFDVQDKAQLREKLLTKAANTVLITRGSSYESLVNNSYPEVSIACSDGTKLTLKRRSEITSDQRRW